MPKARKEINNGLPERWSIRHGAYYYSVKPGHEKFWEFKQLYRLGGTFEEALETFSRIGSRTDHDDIPHEKLKCHPEIIRASYKISLAGVYFLINEGIVVYVGRSPNIPSRLEAHMGHIPFDSIHTIAAEGFEMERLEQLYIAAFTPKYNIYHKSKIL